MQAGGAVLEEQEAGLRLQGDRAPPRRGARPLREDHRGGREARGPGPGQEDRGGRGEEDRQVTLCDPCRDRDAIDSLRVYYLYYK